MNRYYVVHKPYGYLSQFSGEPNDLTLMHLVRDNQLKDFPKDIYPVGRLDKDSEGLLLLTNDNKFKTDLLDPKKKHFKTYWVQVEGEFTSGEAAKINAGGIEIKHNGKTHVCLPAKAKVLTQVEIPERNPPIRFRASIPTTWVEVQLREGKNRQIRKMTAALGFPALRLIRVGIGNLDLEDFPLGIVKEIPFSRL